MARCALSRIAFTTATIIALGAAGCGGGGGVEGTYATGEYKLELLGGGKATFTLMGTPFECTYTSQEKAVTLSCPARDTVTLTMNDDGSLIDPFVGEMKRVN